MIGMGIGIDVCVGAGGLLEAPVLTEAVRNGRLPGVSDRLPLRPLVLDGHLPVTGEPNAEVRLLDGIVSQEVDGRALNVDGGEDFSGLCGRTGDGRYGGVIRIGEITPRFCHYLRFMNEAALLESGFEEGRHHYSRMDGAVLPGVFERWESSEDGCCHSFWIREGIRWSDGIEVTTEDVRFAVCDVLLNPKLRRFLTNSEGANILMPEWEWLVWGDRPVKLIISDKYRFSLVFGMPYHVFVRQQVRCARWQMLLRPSHYLKRFHEDYADAGALRERMEADGFGDRDWADFYQFRDPAVREAGYHLPVRIPEIWKVPVLDPWIFSEDSSAERMRLVRNPYFYAVDGEGRQLPYLDGIIRILYPDGEALRKAEWSGELDLCGCFTKITDAVRFMGRNAVWAGNGEAAAGDVRGSLPDVSGMRIELLPLWQVQQVILLINLCPEQEWLRPLLTDVRFRRAVSLSINRERLRDEVFAGYGTVSQLTCGRERAWYREEYAYAYADYDPKEARRLFLEAGLEGDELEGKGCFRYLGRDVVFRMVYYPVTPMADEAAGRISEDLAGAGLAIERIRLNSGSDMGPYQEANSHVFTIWEMAGDDPLIPYQIGGLSDPVPLWWKWYETGGREGVEPTEEGKRLYRLRDEMKMAANEEQRQRLAAEIYRLQAENLWCIGTVAEVPQPFLYSERMDEAGIRLACGMGKRVIPAVLGAARTMWLKGSDDTKERCHGSARYQIGRQS